MTAASGGHSKETIAAPPARLDGIARNIPNVFECLVSAAMLTVPPSGVDATVTVETVHAALADLFQRQRQRHALLKLLPPGASVKAALAQLPKPEQSAAAAALPPFFHAQRWLPALEPRVLLVSKTGAMLLLDANGLVCHSLPARCALELKHVARDIAAANFEKIKGDNGDDDSEGQHVAVFPEIVVQLASPPATFLLLRFALENDATATTAASASGALRRTASMRKDSLVLQPPASRLEAFVRALRDTTPAIAAAMAPPPPPPPPKPDALPVPNDESPPAQKAVPDDAEACAALQEEIDRLTARVQQLGAEHFALRMQRQARRRELNRAQARVLSPQRVLALASLLWQIAERRLVAEAHQHL